MTIAILASWSLVQTGNDIYIPTTHYLYLDYVAKIYDKVYSLGGILIIIADHGNCDVMWDENHNPVTSHTTNPVPCIITKKGITIHKGKLADVAPTMIELLGLEIPIEMTGKSLIDA